MERYGPATTEGSQSDPSPEWTTTGPKTGLEDPMWQLGLGGAELYPERPEEADCIHYLRTGLCAYGSRCRFNHPRDRGAVIGAARPGGGEYPERVGQPVCQYYMKTGTCKFGASCKYHHPRQGEESVTSVSLNYYGYPLRPGEKDCSDCVKTGHCKFGATCKFHHPQPGGTQAPTVSLAPSVAAAPAPTLYPDLQSPSVPSTQQYGMVVARPPLPPGSCVQSPYGPFLVPPSMVPFPGWSTYSVPISPVPSPGTQPAVGSGYYGITHVSPPTYNGIYQSLPSFGPSSSSQKEQSFPERPGQPECQYYMRTRDCKFGSSCRYHHPPELIAPKTNVLLGPNGLPLRPRSDAVEDIDLNLLLQKQQLRSEEKISLTVPAESSIFFPISIQFYYIYLKQLWHGWKSFNNLTLINLGCLKEASCFPDLSSCSSLMSLGLSGCTRLASLDLFAYSRLESLDISTCTRLMSLDFFACLRLMSLCFSACSKLKSLDLSACSRLQSLYLSACTRLKILDLSTCSKLKILFLSNCSRLEILNLSSCSRLKILYFCGCSRLEILNLSGCSRLESLNLSGCSRLESLNLSGCKRLKSLNLSGCSRVKSLNLSGSSGLVSLDLSGCSGLVSLELLSNSRLGSLYLTARSRLKVHGISKLGRPVEASGKFSAEPLLVRARQRLHQLLQSKRIEYSSETSGNEAIEKQLTSETRAELFEIKDPDVKLESGERIEKRETSDMGFEKCSNLVIQRDIQICLMQGGLGLKEPPNDELWENVERICLMDNELSVLPQNPKCPALLALFLQRNYTLRSIPSSFFNDMSALQILNLSRTSIRSLPESIIELVSLKRLFLNECHCFMMLSPKVGELKRLEVLDLEGTDILKLPKEIKELTYLTCLKVSLYSYSEDGGSDKQLDSVIHSDVISTLSHLEELSIYVNPDDKWWIACVEAIVTEICSLKNLDNLEFYFPRVELVSQFLSNSSILPSLSHFRFTVGQHIERILSRLPRDVEFELQRSERCLKYINGVAVLEEIKKLLQYSTAFFLERHAIVKRLSEFGIGNMEKLQCCVVGECNEVEVIIDEFDSYEEDDENDETNSYKEDDEEETSEEDDCSELGSISSVNKIILNSLEYLYIYYMKNLKRIWGGPVEVKCFSHLKSLTLRTCPKLITIFTKALLDNLNNLEELIVEDCPSVATLVSYGISANKNVSCSFPNLKRILLHYMPGLVTFPSGAVSTSKLEWMSFYNCPNLKSLPIEEVSNEHLKKIRAEESWWEALEWRNGRPGYLAKIFVPID